MRYHDINAKVINALCFYHCIELSFTDKVCLVLGSLNLKGAAGIVKAGRKLAEVLTKVKEVKEKKWRFRIAA